MCQVYLSLPVGVWLLQIFAVVWLWEFLSSEDSVLLIFKLIGSQQFIMLLLSEFLGVFFFGCLGFCMCVLLLGFWFFGFFLGFFGGWCFFCLVRRLETSCISGQRIFRNFHLADIFQSPWIRLLFLNKWLLKWSFPNSGVHVSSRI